MLKLSDLLIYICLIFCISPLVAQNLAIVKGTVKDELDEGLSFANVILLIEGKERDGVGAEVDGTFKISVPSNTRFQLRFSFIGYKSRTTAVLELEANEVYKIPDIVLSETQEFEIVVEGNRERDAQVISREDFQTLANTTGNLESMLQFMASGVSAGTGGELTSQYSVRGGNYDENLIYVNGFEIYRPLLIRASQQEGLTFPNPDMLDNLLFSNGGFKAQYGDKMSSVLDVKYRRPNRKFESSFGASLLGAQAYVGGNKRLSLHRRVSATLGARYKTTQYLLNSQAIRGEYVPNFVDIQSNIIFDINKRMQLELLGNYNLSSFSLVPEDGSNDTGLFNYVLNLYSRFQGMEKDDFKTGMIAASFSISGDSSRQKIRRDSSKTSQANKHRFFLSYYQSLENERIDRIAEYYLTIKESNLGSENFGEPAATLGYGITHLFARNFLTMSVATAEYRGVFNYNVYKDARKKEFYNLTQWGASYKNEQITDDLKEWTRNDSLYYTVPFDTTALFIPDYVRTKISLNTHRLQGFVQHSWKYINPVHQLEIIGGVRGNYSSLNGELVISPRMQLFYTPQKYSNPLADSTKKTKDLTFKLCIGGYNQPPFYRELRDLAGRVNTQVKAQRSWQVLTGLVWDFVAFKRRFKFITEGYYKHQFNMVAYDVENVRVRYYGNNNLSGYIAGWDFRMNGEFVKGLESWINLSFMRARERFDSVQHQLRTFEEGQIVVKDVDDVAKPTNQLFLFSMFFQDNLPNATWAQVNVALTVGSGMSFGIPRDNVVFRNTYSYLPYHRIDIGFSFVLWNQQKYIKKRFENDEDLFRSGEKSLLKKNLRSAWLSIEVFNLMQVANQSSYNWIKTFDGVNYGIPNTLTSRRLNLRFRVEF